MEAQINKCMDEKFRTFERNTIIYILHSIPPGFTQSDIVLIEIIKLWQRHNFVDDIIVNICVLLKKLKNELVILKLL